MIDCTRCGNDSRDDDMFCAACGAYLDWFGQPVVREEPEPEPVVEPQVLSSASPSVALVPRIRTVVGRPGTRPPEARRQGLRAGGDAPEPVVVPIRRRYGRRWLRPRSRASWSGPSGRRWWPWLRGG